MTFRPIEIERILFPTDFSPFSAQALRHALALTRKLKTRLKVIHVVPNVIQPADAMYLSAPAAYMSAPWMLTPEGRQKLEQDMRNFMAPAREARIDYEVEVVEGDPWREILAAAEAMPADLVVMGTHGRSGLERLFLGSVAEKLIRRLPCPVLTVSHEEGRTWEAPGLVTRILCATDFSDLSSQTLSFALALAEKDDAALSLVHVVDNLPDIGDPRYPAVPALSDLRADYEKEAYKRLEEMVKAIGKTLVKIDARVSVGRPYKEILRLAVEMRADLIVIGAQGHGALEHLLSGSNAQHVIRQATCPVLTVRPVSGRKEKDSGPHSLALAEPAKTASKKGGRS